MFVLFRPRPSQKTETLWLFYLKIPNMHYMFRLTLRSHGIWFTMNLHHHQHIYDGLLLYKRKLIEIAGHHANKLQVRVTWVAFSGKDRQINDRKFFFFTGCHFLQFACISSRTGRGNNLWLGRLIVQIWNRLLPWNDNSVIYGDLSLNYAQAWRHKKFIVIRRDFWKCIYDVYSAVVHVVWFLRFWY